MNENIKNKLREKFLNETTSSEHLFDRLKGRINKLSENEVSSEEKGYLETYLNILLKMDFDKRKSFAVKVLDLNINEESDMYYNIKGRSYYRINDFMGKDSTGNEIWVVIRNNRAITIMLRKDIQPVEKLRVDFIAKDINDLQTLIKRNLAK